MNTLALLIECDPGQTLGGSCCRDVNNMANAILALGQNSTTVNIFTTNLSKITKIINENVVYYDTNNLFSVLNQLIHKQYNTIIILLSGHGYTTRDLSGDEISGQDGMIKISNTYILDDQIYESIVKPLKCKNMLLLSDTCHSGTMFDLPYLLTNDNPGVFSKYTHRNDKLDKFAISLSACTDQQLSMCDVGDKTGFGGSLTTAVLNIDSCLQNLLKGMNSNNKVVLLDEYKKIKKRLQMLNQQVQMEASQIL
jgi:hypothetical protein